MCNMCIGRTISIPLLVFISIGDMGNHGMQLRRWMLALESMIHSIIAIKVTVAQFATYLAGSPRTLGCREPVL
jgi:hypothetical protein